MNLPRPPAFFVLLFALTCCALTSCDNIDALLHPYDETAPTRVLPAPVTAGGEIALYPGINGDIAIQSRPGDCATSLCSVLVRGRWRPLAAPDAHGVSLLSASEAIGGSYHEDLWQPLTASDRFILVNSTAGAANLKAGLFDGLRIGVRDKIHATYVTAYAIDGGATSVIVNADKAWLLHNRPDHSADLVDLFAVAQKPLVICMPGLILDTAGRWAGPPEKALSPDIFVSRNIDKTANPARRQALSRICHPAKAKGIP